MGDTARWKVPARDGASQLPRLDDVSGRMAEHLVGPNGVIVDPSAVIHLIGVVIAPSWVRKFQLQQQSVSDFLLIVESNHCVPDHAQREGLRNRLETELSHLTRAHVNVELTIVEHIPPLPSGKHLYCVKTF
jgi:hypothetical protein